MFNLPLLSNTGSCVGLGIFSVSNAVGAIGKSIKMILNDYFMTNVKKFLPEFVGVCGLCKKA